MREGWWGGRDSIWWPRGSREVERGIVFAEVLECAKVQARLH